MKRGLICLLTVIPSAILCAGAANAAAPPDAWESMAATRPAADIDPPSPVIPDHKFNLKDFGAVGDGKTFNTEAFAKAIAAVKQAGGGQLIVPAGTYLTLPITLTSHIDLHLEAGSTILFPDDLTAYGLPDPANATQDQVDAAKDKDPDSLISGENLTDVAITGSGTIDGGGKVWWATVFAGFRTSGKVHIERPKLLIINNSRRVLIQGVTFTNSPMWNVVPTLCTDVRVENIKVLEPELSPNTDAIDPTACQNVLIRDCLLDEGDDCIAVKAIGGVCANILIENLTCKHGHGISVGSETYGGVHNVFVRHCTFDGTKIGIRIKSARDRGNNIYGFTFDDIKLNDVGTAIDIDMYYHDKTGAKSHGPQPITASTPLLKDVLIHDVTATKINKAGRIIGLPEQLADGVTLTNVQISSKTGMDIQDAKNIVFNQVKIIPTQGDPITTENAQLTNNP
jgi:polygalacturonase